MGVEDKIVKVAGEGQSKGQLSDVFQFLKASVARQFDGRDECRYCGERHAKFRRKAVDARGAHEIWRCSFCRTTDTRYSES